MSRASARRGLVVVLVVVAVLTGILDLLRPGSFILGTWHRVHRTQTPMERAVKEFQRTRAIPLPRSNRVDGQGTRTGIPPTQLFIPG